MIWRMVVESPTEAGPSTPYPPSSFSWWELKWRSSPTALAPASSSPSLVIDREDKPPLEIAEKTGWERVTELYTTESFEKDIILRVSRTTFICGFMLGGISGSREAKHQYETANKATKYLSPSDSIKRRVDYAIVRFAKRGFSVGLRCAFITGTIVMLTTHTAAWRRRFSWTYFPVVSGPMALLLHTAAVGGVFTFPLGIIGMTKAIALGLSSGLTLSAVAGLYALSMDRSVDSAYWHFKKEYEAELLEKGWFEKRVHEVIQERKCWRYEAVKIVKEELDSGLGKHDD